MSLNCIRSAIACACTALVLLGSAGATAQGWPSKPVRLIVPANAGGGTADPISRLLADELSRVLGQRVFVENRGGANGNIGALAAAKADPDGYTLLFSWAGTLATNVSLYRNMPLDPRRDLLPIVLIGNVPNILVVHPGTPVGTLKEFTDYARANPGKLNYGSTGNGSSMHLAAEMFKRQTGAQMTHIPYNSVPKALNDLMTGDIHVMFQLVPGVQQQVRAGRFRALATMSARRSEGLPEVPTFAEAGMQGMEAGTWFGFLAPRSTPSQVLARVNAEVNQLLRDPRVRPRLVAMGLEPIGGTSEQFAAFWDAEIRRWAEVVRFSGAKLD